MQLKDKDSSIGKGLKFQVLFGHVCRTITRGMVVDGDSNIDKVGFNKDSLCA